MYLLRRSGFSLVDYVALDPGHAGDSGFYDALEGAGITRKQELADLRPWWGFVLRMVALAARELHDRLSPGGAETRSAHVRDVILGLPHEFTVADAEQAAPSVSRTTISRVLRRMYRSREITKVQSGRYAMWRHGIPSGA